MKWLTTFINNIYELKTTIEELNNSDTGSGVSDLTIEELKEYMEKAFMKHEN